MRLDDLLNIDPDLKYVFINENEFDVVNNINDATHLIVADEREDSLKWNGLTNGKIYEIELDEDDYHVTDDDGLWNSTAIITVSHFLLKKK